MSCISMTIFIHVHKLKCNCQNTVLFVCASSLGEGSIFFLQVWHVSASPAVTASTFAHVLITRRACVFLQKSAMLELSPASPLCLWQPKNFSSGSWHRRSEAKLQRWSFLWPLQLICQKRGGKKQTRVPHIQSLITQEHKENRRKKYHSSMNQTAGS